MPSKTQEEGRLTRYLLGGLAGRERERLEEDFFADDDAFEQLLAAEDDLIDAYARGELSADERRRFEELLLASPGVRERVQFARSLAGAVSDARPAAATPEDAAPPSRLPFFVALFGRGAALRYAFVAAALALAVGLAWLVFQRAWTGEESRAERAQRGGKTQEVELPADVEREETPAPPEAERARPTPEVAQQGTEEVKPQPRPQADRPTRERVKKNDVLVTRRSTNNRAREDASTAENAALPNTNTGAGTMRPDRRRGPEQSLAHNSAAFELTPGLVRGSGGANTLALPPRVTFISLQLNLESPPAHADYSATIESADGRVVWRSDPARPLRLSAAAGKVDLPAVPARDLPPGDYVLLLRGRQPDGSFESVADYSFRIVRK